MRLTGLTKQESKNGLARRMVTKLLTIPVLELLETLDKSLNHALTLTCQ
jgi:hypothetical protein